MFVPYIFVASVLLMSSPYRVLLSTPKIVPSVPPVMSEAEPYLLPPAQALTISNLQSSPLIRNYHQILGPAIRQLLSAPLIQLFIHSFNLPSTAQPGYRDSQQKSKNWPIEDVSVLAKHRVKLNESEKRDKYQDLARKMKKLWNMKGTV